MQFSFKFYLLKILLIWFDLIRSRRRVESISLICVNLILSLAEIICDEKGEIWYLMQSQWQENQFWKRIKSYISRLVAFVVVSVTLAVVVVVVFCWSYSFESGTCFGRLFVNRKQYILPSQFAWNEIGGGITTKWWREWGGIPAHERPMKKDFPSKCYVLFLPMATIHHRLSRSGMIHSKNHINDHTTRLVRRWERVSEEKERDVGFIWTKVDCCIV